MIHGIDRRHRFIQLPVALLVVVSVFQGRYQFGQALSRNDDVPSNTAVHSKENVTKEGLVKSHHSEYLMSFLQPRLSELFQNTKTEECRTKILTAVGEQLHTIIGEQDPLPFSRTSYNNKCPEVVYEDWSDLPEGMHIGHIQNRTYPPEDHDRSEYTYVGSESIELVYGILTHRDTTNATIRLINSLQHAHTNFVVHVDAKEESDATYQQLVQFAQQHDNIWVLPQHRRVRIAWGGYSMVNATLQMLHYIFDDIPDLHFHKFVHLSASTYPLASNIEIRNKVASFPIDTNFFYVIMKPLVPSIWYYFVECDDTLHRIAPLHALHNETNNAYLFTTSQWFIASYDFARYLVEQPDESFVQQFMDYIQHVVVADETFFGTVLRNTHFCQTHHNSNWLHLQFDRWESELPEDQRDPQKCMMKDPNHCGRSPTIMTLDYVDMLELSDDLFARKFDDLQDSEIKDLIDRWREDRDVRLQQNLPAREDHSLVFEGNLGTLIVAKETVNSSMPLCLGLGEEGNRLHLVPCFHDWVPPILADDWHFGGVIEKETLPNNHWDFGPCTSNGVLQRQPDGQMKVLRNGTMSAEIGPRCMMHMKTGSREGRCFDGDSGETQPGGSAHVFPCVKRWQQFLSFGGTQEDVEPGSRPIVPVNSLFMSIPLHLVKQYKLMGKAEDHSPYMCLGVFGRGDADEVDWDPSDEEDSEDSGDEEDRRGLPLDEFVHEEVVTTQCTNSGGVIEWLFIPFLVEDEAEVEEIGEVGDEL